MKNKEFYNRHNFLRVLMSGKGVQIKDPSRYLTLVPTIYEK